MREQSDSIAGVILGTAVGDALGLPREGLSRNRARRLFGAPPLRHRFLCCRGMVSDDTEHTCMVAQALLRAPDDVERFARSLAWRLRFWLLGLPAGLGRATLQGIIKLWLGFPPTHSGVYSAGNGPAMRAALLGVCLGQDVERLRAFVRASTRMTHTDIRAEQGAFLIALAAHWGASHDPENLHMAHFLPEARAALPDADAELLGWLGKIEDHLQRNLPAVELADTLGMQRGVTGYVYHTVPLALYCWLRSPTDFRRAVEEAIELGGDTDTVGAIVGALVGATLGADRIPKEWLDGLLEWPRSVRWLRSLAQRLACQRSAATGPIAQPACRLCWPGLIPRNLLFFLVVLGHAVRRLLPPY